MSLARILRNFARLERDENGIVKVVSGISCMRLIEGIPIFGTILAFRRQRRDEGTLGSSLNKYIVFRGRKH